MMVDSFMVTVGKEISKGPSGKIASPPSSSGVLSSVLPRYPARVLGYARLETGLVSRVW